MRRGGQEEEVEIEVGEEEEEDAGEEQEDRVLVREEDQGREVHSFFYKNRVYNNINLRLAENLRTF